MKNLEYELIEKFRRLDRATQQHVYDLIDKALLDQAAQPAQGFDMDKWLRQADTLRQHVDGYNKEMISASDLVNEVREERDADILRSTGFGDSAGDSAD